MAVAEELIVALKSEGARQTERDVDSVNKSVSNTNETVGDTAENFGDFQTEISGAMTAVIAGLAVAAGGLASQIPVIGGFLEGLRAVIAGVAFQIDQVLRPLFEPITNKLFEWSNAIFEADGALGRLIGAIGGAAVILGTLVPIILTLVKVAAALGISWGTVTAAFSSAIGVISAVAAGLISWPALLAGILLALGAFAVAYFTNWKGIRDKTNKILGELRDKAVSIFNDLADRLTSWASDVASDAVEWGKNIIGSLIDGIQSRKPNLSNILSNIAQSIKSKIGVDVDSNTGTSSTGRIPGNMGGGNGSVVSMDGRRLEERTGRYGRSNTTRRGI